MSVVSVPTQTPFLYNDDMKSRNLVVPLHAQFVPASSMINLLYFFNMEQD